jgi:hypothetical protein
MNKNDYILEHFVGNDELRPALSQINKEGNFNYSTNGIVLCRVPDCLCEKKYIKHEEAPNFETFYNSEFEKAEKIGVLKRDNLLSYIREIKIAIGNISTQCKECDGYGDKYCDCCGNRNDCKECNGTGENIQPAKVLIRNVSYNDDYHEKSYKVQIADNLYSPIYIELLVLSMFIAGVEECNLYQTSTQGFFIFNDVEILIMKMTND